MNCGDRRDLPWWDETTMAGLFTTTSPATTSQIQAAYDHLAARFRADLYVTRQTRPLLTAQPQPPPAAQ